MALSGSKPLSYIFAGVLLAIVLLPDFPEAGPVGQRLKGDEGDKETVSLEKAEAPGMLKKLVRSRRNISWYKQHSDFWGWYKYFTDTGNQEGVNELDRVYLQYLQNKNRAEGRRSYDMYLRHLAQVYKACSNSDDPECISELTSKPKPKTKAEPSAPAPAPAPVKGCDPYRDPYCQVARSAPKAPVMAPAPFKAPSPGYYYYVPPPQPFLSAKQKAELLRICNPADVECLQYHLRAAYGYKPAPATVAAPPSYAYLGFDSKKAPFSMPQKPKKEVYHHYPNCNPDYDPYCTPETPQAVQAPSQVQPSRCNPLFDDNCNPLSAVKMAGYTAPRPKTECDPYYDPSCRQEYRPKDEPAPDTGCDPRYDPYCTQGSSNAHSEPQVDPWRSQQIKGKTKEGYDCYVHYDEECYPVRSSSPSQASATSTRPNCDPYDPSCPLYYSANNPMRSAIESPQTDCHPYDPSCRKPIPQAPSAPESYHPDHNPTGHRDGVIEPDPDCDPEYDHNCRLRRSEAPQDNMKSENKVTEDSKNEPTHQEEPFYDPRRDEGPSYDHQQYDPYQGRQEDPYNPYTGYGGQEHPEHRYDEAQRGYEDQYPRYDESQGHYLSTDHASAGEYKK
ncbi:actinodin1 [Amia ocellicauda]|uniref:actinodin1 n=1 Tax=Amia ocellicauda TaxID=2972642 RepID=UPI003464E8C0